MVRKIKTPSRFRHALRNKTASRLPATSLRTSPAIRTICSFPDKNNVTQRAWVSRNMYHLTNPIFFFPVGLFDWARGCEVLFFNFNVGESLVRIEMHAVLATDPLQTLLHVRLELCMRYVWATHFCQVYKKNKWREMILTSPHWLITQSSLQFNGIHSIGKVEHLGELTYSFPPSICVEVSLKGARKGGRGLTL